MRLLQLITRLILGSCPTNLQCLALVSLAVAAEPISHVLRHSQHRHIMVVRTSGLTQVCQRMAVLHALVHLILTQPPLPQARATLLRRQVILDQVCLALLLLLEEVPIHSPVVLHTHHLQGILLTLLLLDLHLIILHLDLLRILRPQHHPRIHLPLVLRTLQLRRQVVHRCMGMETRSHMVGRASLVFRHLPHTRLQHQLIPGKPGQPILGSREGHPLIFHLSLPMGPATIGHLELHRRKALLFLGADRRRSPVRRRHLTTQLTPLLAAPRSHRIMAHLQLRRCLKMDRLI